VRDKERQKREHEIDEHVAPAQVSAHRFAQIPNLVVPPDFDQPLTEPEITAWEGNSH
jgi:hypothetical protein